MTLESLPWNPAEAGDALRLLAGPDAELRPLPRVPDAICSDAAAFERWVDDAAARLGVEAEAVHVSGAELERFVRDAAPALLRVGPPDSSRLLVLRSARGSACLVAPDGRQHRIPIAAVVRALVQTHAPLYLKSSNALLDAANIQGPRREKVLEALVRRRLADRPIPAGWLVRLPPSASVGHQLQQVRAAGRIARLFLGHAALWGLSVFAWGLLGRGVLSGRLDYGWLWEIGRAHV